MTVTGAQGSLRWGYHTAATLSAWTMTKDGDGWSLTATVAESNTFRVSQRPLVFIAPHKDGAWRFPVLELQIAGVTLTASLGSREK